MVRIGAVGRNASMLADSSNLVAFENAEALLDFEERVDAVWVVSAGPEAVAEDLRKLRGSAAYAFRPIFVDEKIDGYAAFLHDGVAAMTAELLAKARPILSRLKGLDTEGLGKTSALRLLAYLYLRPGSELEAYRHWDVEGIAVYPVAELLNDSGVDTPGWLELLARRGLLEKSRLIDRLRLCPACERPHHNFVDVCPEDHILEIRKVDFVHCFTCGYVGPENEFFREGIFVCPNCKTQLRHIGVDYDRPLESYICANGHKFIEPDVMAECLVCGAKNPPDALIPREIHAYAITTDGALAVRAGEIGDLYAVLDRTNYARPDYFLSLLDWLLKLHRRAPEERFSVLAIRLLNIPRLIDTLGRGKVLEFLDEFAERLRRLLRTTDITTRTNETDIYILLPKTPRAGCATVMERLEELKELIASGAHHIEFSLACETVGEGESPYDSAKVLMADLTARLADFSDKKEE